MVFILPPSSRSAMAGESIGTGLSQALEMLASQKAQQLGAQRQQSASAQALESLGLPPALAGVDPAIAKELLSQSGKASQMQALQSILGGSQEMFEESEQQGPEGITDEQILAVSSIDPQMARLLQSQKESQQREKIAAFKETKEIRKEYRDQAKSASENIARLDRMDELIDNKKLTNPLLYTALSKFGLDMPALLSPDSQEFQKLTVDFLRDARQIFGARVSNYEVQQFLKAIPSLLQTDEGKRRVIRNLRTLAQGAKIRADVARKIIKENNGVAPFDLAEQVEERSEKELNDLYDRFSKGMGTEEKEQGQTVRIKLPDGRIGNISKDRLEEALSAGATAL